MVRGVDDFKVRTLRGEGTSKRTKAYKGEGDKKSMNIEGTYFLNGPIES